VLLAALTLSCAASCARTSQSLSNPERAAPAGAAEFDESPVELPRYRSRRLGLSLPLPGGRAWTIDDHSRPELVAKHAPTRSMVMVAVLRTNETVGRDQCEELAKAQGLVAVGPLSVLEDEIAITQKSFDTRIRVALEAPLPHRPLVGHVSAFGGFLHKCYVFDFTTQVDDATGEAALSARLAFARTRILTGLELDPFATLPAGRGAASEAPR